MSRRFILTTLACLLFIVPALSFASPQPPQNLVQEMSAKVSNPNLILFQAGQFDPRSRIPQNDAFSLSGWRDRSSGNLTYIVQFDRSPTTVDRQALMDQGAVLGSYIPNNAYLVKLSASKLGTISSIPHVRAVLRMPKWAKIHSSLWDQTGNEVQFEILASPGSGGIGVARDLTTRFPDLQILTEARHHAQGRLTIAAPVSQLRQVLDRASGLEAVQSILPYEPMQLLNDDSIWVCQNYDTANTTNYALSATIWNHGITGTGQIVCVNDSGLDSDMCYFRYDGALSSKTTFQVAIPPAIGTVDNSKKVVAYYLEPGADSYDTGSANYHGTHVSGSVLGDNYATLSTPVSAGHDNGDGMAPNAQLVMQDVGDSGGGLAGLAGDLTDMFQQANDAGARIHSDSWGTTASNYSATSMDMDEFMYRHEDFLFLVAMGNSGTAPGDGSIGSPATAKNIVSVGATTNGGAGSQADNLMSYSRGPVDDGRLKPDVSTPGSGINSAAGTTSNTDDNCGPKGMSGTSMATPTTSGLTALLRQYYTDGFYPTGTKVAADAKSPSGALMKASLTNGATPLGGTDNVTGGAVSTRPSMDQGWGRTHLDNALFFIGDLRKLRVWDVRNADGIQTAEQTEYIIDVTSSAQPLEVRLVWTDPESTTLALVNLVNNLDLEVVEPGGATTYLGNVYTGGNSTTGGSADVLNPIEGVSIAAPATGLWTLRVLGTAVPGTGTAPYSDRQGYALVATFADCPSGLAAPLGFTATDNGVTGIDLAWSPVPGATSYLVFKALGAAPGPEEYTLLDTTTLTTFTDTLVQGGYTYSYVVRATDDCNESPASAPDFATFSGNCVLLPAFVGLTSVANDTGTALCDLLLTWSAGSSSCPLGNGIGYNIYKSTDPYFIPGVGNLISSGEAGPTYTDYFVNPMVTYYYVVRAEDTTTLNGGPNNGGNEDTNNIKLMATPWANTSSPGIFTDDGGDTNAKLFLDAGWVVTNQQNNTGGGAYSYHNALDGNTYSAGLCIAATTPAIDLQAAAPQLSYWVNYNIEIDWDGVVVEISTDGGGIWTPTAPLAGYTGDFNQTGNPPINACAYDASQACFNGPAGNGTLTGWTQYTHDLTAYAGQSVLIRWNFSTDGGAEFEGFYLDDIQITDASVNDACATSNGSVKFDNTVYHCNGDTITINVGDSDLLGQVTQDVTVESSTEIVPETVTLTETPPNTGNFIGSILSTNGPPATDGLLSIVGGDTLTVTYIDLDDGLGGFDVVKTDNATADCTPPVISNVAIINVSPNSATVTWTTDELADSLVTYEDFSPPSANTQGVAAYVTIHSVDLTGLASCTGYWLFVQSADPSGNGATDDNGGAYYFFTTLGGGSDNFPSTDTPTPIPDNDAGGITSILNVVPSTVGNLTNVLVNINITHTYQGDLIVELTSPLGTIVRLHDRTGGTTEDIITTYDSLTVPDGPGIMNDFDGEDPAGDWTLFVSDNAGIDTGTLNNWSLDLEWSGPCGPFFLYDSNVYSDCGNADGVIDPGEQVDLDVTVQNLGIDDGFNITGTLTSPTPGITINTPGVSFPNALIGAFTTNATPFVFTVGGAFVCGTPIDFNLQLNYEDTGGSPMTNTVSLQLPTGTGGPGVIFSENLDASPGWTMAGDWEFGAPQGLGGASGNADPLAAPTGTNVYGNDLSVDGDYPASVTDYTLTTGSYDCSGWTNVTLEFQEYLNVESFTFDQATVEVNNGGGWQVAWANPGSSITTTVWSLKSVDVSAWADNQASVQFRWNLSSDSSMQYSGWNIDDIVLRGDQPPVCNPATCSLGCITSAANAAGGPTTFCAGGSVNLTATADDGTGPYTYLWSPGGATTQVLNVTASGTYSCDVTDTSGGCGNTVGSNAIAVTVNALPAVPAIIPDGPTTFCAGGSVNLASSAASGYLWAPGGATSQTINVTASDSYSVTITDGNGCLRQTTVDTVVTVNALPAVPTITPDGPTTFCAGGSVNLASSAAVGYLWAPGGETTQTINVTVGDSYSVTITDGNGCQSTSLDEVVVVNALPAVPVITPDGPTTFCAGGSVNLTSSVAVGYLWAPGAETTQTINVTASGTYTVTITDGNGCQSTSLDEVVVVNTLPAVPTITPTDNCPGTPDSTLVSSAAAGYLWAPGGSTLQTILVPNDGTLYTVTITDINGCQNTSAGWTVPVGCPPVGAPDESSDVEGNGDAPMLVIDEAGNFDTEEVSAADSYNVYEGDFGTWASYSNQSCWDAGAIALGRAALNMPMAAGSHWYLISTSNASGESRAGVDSAGTDHVGTCGANP